MKFVERDAKKKRQRANIQQTVALALYGSAVLSMAVFAPNALTLLKNIDPDLTKKRKPAYRIQQALARLEKRKLVSREKTEKGWRVRLTSEGEKYADRLHRADRVKIRKPTRWDKRWRIVIFDVWERRRGVRDQLRKVLVKAGFRRVQNSVWVHPYDCEELLTFLRADLRLGKGILYIVAEGVENDKQLRQWFGLPSE
ncbi:MAG: PaaX family transcrtiptional regulator [Parcubacteria group bacterium Gr01-1014_56]|nr:MAG: PaaX family transcrtiptional regulator [Parcubacteria group bacterium Gr01-1014_56]